MLDLIGQGADWSNMKLYDDNSRLVPEAEPYTPSSTLRKLNHPLMIMVKEERAVRVNSLIMSDFSGGGHCVFKWLLCGHLKPTPGATI